DRRRAGIVAGLGVALAAVALGLASLLNDPTGPRPSAAQSASAGAARTAPPSAEDLPPLSTLLERPLPGGLATAPPEVAARDLERRLAAQRSPRRLVELGVAYQRLDSPDRAVPLFREALSLDPGFIPARVGLAMAGAGSGAGAAVRAQRSLEALERKFPRNQLVVFNLAWAAIYAQDGPVVIRALERTLALDDSSYLGVVAQSLLQAGRSGSSSSEP
ncbi:MAG TPA: tetratricopeptide repeat protein, partial [Vicinamibacteria bacterium]